MSPARWPLQIHGPVKQLKHRLNETMVKSREFPHTWDHAIGVYNIRLIGLLNNNQKGEANLHQKFSIRRWAKIVIWWGYQWGYQLTQAIIKPGMTEGTNLDIALRYFQHGCLENPPVYSQL